MIILLKVISFSIWLLIMISIISAVLRKHRIPVQDYSQGLVEKGEDQPKVFNGREKT